MIEVDIFLLLLWCFQTHLLISDIVINWLFVIRGGQGDVIILCVCVCDSVCMCASCDHVCCVSAMVCVCVPVCVCGCASVCAIVTVYVCVFHVNDVWCVSAMVCECNCVCVTALEICTSLFFFFS